jgi:hypothetical protein
MKCPCEMYDEVDRLDAVFGICECGHLDDEHDNTFLAPCLVEVS